LKKPADIRDAVLAGLDARRQVTGAVGTTPRQPAYVATFGRQLNDGLKDKIAQLEQERSAGAVVLKLDPRRIAPSAFANRDARSLVAGDPDLAALIANVRVQGQLEPIRLRPAEPSAEFDYEIVYGHRRHAACLALNEEVEGGFPVLALLDAKAADVRDHVLKMYQENAARKDLSAFETGAMFANWLTEKVFTNQTELGSAVGLEQGTVAKYLAISRLPAAVLNAFGDPRVISLRWAESINSALKDRREAVEQVATDLSAEDPRRKPDEVLAALITSNLRSTKRAGAVKTETVKIRGRTLYKIAPRGNGMQITFGARLDPKLAKAAQEEVKEALTRYLQQALKEEQP
jgi:ParB family transcriptional regulator, chromosome partitioning protein